MFYYNKPCWKGMRCSCDGSSDRSFMGDLLSYFPFQPVLHTWCNKGHVCNMLDGAYKRLLAANQKVVTAADFLTRYLNGPLPYVRCHIIILKCVSIGSVYVCTLQLPCRCWSGSIESVYVCTLQIPSRCWSGSIESVYVWTLQIQAGVEVVVLNQYMFVHFSSQAGVEVVVLNQYMFVHFSSQAGVEVVVLNQYMFVHFSSQAGVEVVVLNQYMFEHFRSKQVLKW